MKDLRSAINKEACTLVKLSAETFGIKIESMATKLMSRESLMQIINNGNKLIAENAH